MTTSGTYNYNPSLGELTLYAFNLCGIRNTALVQEHMESARMAANLLLGRWSSQGVNLWTVTKESIPLVQGQATYNVPANNIVMLDTYISTTDGAGNPIDRLILPISRTEYASYPNKEQQGFPTTYWQDRLLNGTVTLWPVPDGTQTSLDFYQVTQIEDANFTNGQTLSLPVYFMEAFAFGLAQRLALIWAPDKVTMLKPLADEAYAIAAAQNVETSNFYIGPVVSGYYRL
jgi:hypothetical protein